MQVCKSFSKKKNHFYSTTVVQADEENACFTWVIENFLLITEKVYWRNNTVNISEGITSGAFTTEDSNQETTTWNLVLWPCIVKESSLNNICDESVGVWLEGMPNKVKLNTKMQVEALLSIIDIDDKKAHSVKLSRCETTDWKWSKNWFNIILRNDLLESHERLLPNGSLTVRCDLAVKYNYSLKTSNSLSINNFNLSEFCGDLKSLFENKKNSDVTIFCKMSAFRAHKAILSARSPVFSKMFENDMTESSTGVVNIEDIEAPVVQRLLQYIYGIEFEISSSICRPLYFAADKYALEELKQHCSSILKANLNDNNVWTTAVAADILNDEILLLAAKTFIKANPSQLLSKAYMEFVINSPNVANRLLE